ncbi:MAG TPA: efflux RND transporter periplasmic adaptor subunit [Bacteroidales bacterium]|nr:efflux RND transporter periplasmic adaptor subunit [Bacteroidales bacterium]
MKRRIIIFSSVFLALIALFVFNKMTSGRAEDSLFAEVKRGSFEITVSNSGELTAEKSLDIRGPDIIQQMQRSMGGGGRGMNMRILELKIQDIVPEGTIVKTGDYIAQMDRSSYSNTLKDAMDQLKTYQTNVEMKILDTAVTLTNLRDEIKNQRYVVEEAKITLDQSKYEPPATIRQAEITLDKAKRSLEQKIKSYQLQHAKVLSEIKHEKKHLDDQQELVTGLQSFLQGFTITAPASGMIIYKKERNGTKRKAGSQLNPFDNTIATLPDLTTMLSKMYVNEIEVSKVKPGQKVNITIDAFPNKAYNGQVLTVANIGEQLPNSDAKMFEVQIKIDGSDPLLRPGMTTTNKIIVKTYDDVVYIPTECVQAGIDSIPFVYEKKHTKQFVVVGEANDKNVVVEQGLEPGKMVFIIPPENADKYKTSGEELIAVTRERNNAKRLENQKLTQTSLLNR